MLNSIIVTAPKTLEVLLAIQTPDLQAQVRDILVRFGHRVIDWKPGEPTPESANLAIIEGLQPVVAAREVPCHILALLDEDEALRVVDSVRQVTDFLVKPFRPRELAARIQLIATQPTWREQVLHRLLATAIERTSDIVEVADPGARLQFVNPAYEKSLGISRDEAIGKTPAQLVRSDAHTPEFWKNLDATLKRGDTWSGVIVSKLRDGRLVHFDTTITPIADRSGRFTHHVGVKRDITERLEKSEALLQANRALEQARDAALAASRAKSEFLANMSHELRTPLNAIIGYSEMLMDELEDPSSQTHEDLKRIRAAGGHLLALIDDVLDISKIEADRVELITEEFSVGDLVDGVAAMVKPLAEKNGNALVLDRAPEVSTVYADRTRLRQILFNLLSNACKFTKSGTVSLGVRHVDKKRRRFIEFRVTDTGIGITKEQQAKLFQPFVQADSSTTREYGGTGLGLVICKRLTEIMGGTIELESEIGKGSTMRVCLPVGAPDEEPDTVEQQRPRLPGTPAVLVIDDDDDVRELAARILAKRGFVVQTAATGPTGIEMAARMRPDAIILDVKMPGMSGWDVLSALKLSEKTSGIPVIMLTVMHQEEVGRALGAVDYLIKPLEPRALVATLHRHIRAEGARVLVVEDDEATRSLVTRTLRAAGHVVIEAENGKVALEAIAVEVPQIIVLDLMMPVMDGMMFLHHLRANPAHAEIPVVVATAQSLSEAERRQLELSAQHVIEKKGHSRSDLLQLIADEIQSRVKDTKLPPPPAR